MVTANAPRSIVVIDIGSSNAKAVQFDAALQVLDAVEQPSPQIDGPPYLHLDPEPVLGFARAAIARFDRARPVDAIVPCTHGSALALMDADGALALPIMSYLAEVPDDIAAAYAAIEPDFDEVLAPVNPGALTLGRQLLWQQTASPEAFARVRTILPYAQYLAFRLTGVAASEVSALGAQTHLWAPKARDFSALARARGWADRFAPIRKAWEVLGPCDLPLTGRGAVHVGVHDSNANFFRYRDLAPLAFLSTGTWIIGFDSDAPLDGLDGTRDQVSNTTVTGAPVACARFMGGAEFAALAGTAPAGAARAEVVAALIERGTVALPSFTDSGGPVPGTGGKGRVTGPAPEGDAEHASLAALYCAQMTAVMLDAMGRTRRIVIDGPFSRNAPYLAALAALLPRRGIYRSKEEGGTATGAAMLAFGPAPKAPPPGPEIEPVAAADLPGLAVYHAEWLSEIR